MRLIWDRSASCSWDCSVAATPRGSRSEVYALAAECLDQLPRRDQTLVEAVNERMRLWFGLVMGKS